MGSHAEVASRIEEYADRGISEFVLSGYPHLEEAYWFGEGGLPLLRSRGLWHGPDEHELARRSGDGTVPFAPANNV